MTKQELVKGLTYMGLAYGKEFTPQECDIYYDFLQEYSYETFITAIKNTIKKSKFLPKVTELIDSCEGAKEVLKIDVIEYMNNHGYFKSPIEYEKTTRFIESGIVPKWLQDDINKYYKEMISNRLEHKETLLLA